MRMGFASVLANPRLPSPLRKAASTGLSSVVPAFYERDAQGIPRGWVRRIRASLRTMATGFSTRRMLREHVERVYRT